MSVSMVSEVSGKDVNKLYWIMLYLTQPHSEELLAVIQYSGNPSFPHPREAFPDSGKTEQPLCL